MKRIFTLLLIVVLFSGYKTKEPPKIEDKDTSEYLKILRNKIDVFEVVTTAPNGNYNGRYGQNVVYKNGTDYSLWTCVSSPSGTSWQIVTGGIGSSITGYLYVQDEGSTLATQPILNFIGSTISCVDDPGNTRTNCTLTSSGGTTSPGGSDTQVQFNDAGSFGGDAGFTYNKTTNTPTITGNLVMSDTTSSAGAIMDGSNRFIHNYGFSGSSDGNTFIGINSGNFSTADIENTAVGYESLNAVNGGSSNVAIGYRALKNTTGADTSVAIGSQSLENTTTGDNNTAVGQLSMNSNRTGFDNVCIGNSCLYNNISSNKNIAVGNASLFTTTGGSNTALGDRAGINNRGGIQNSFIGTSTADSAANHSGNLNTYIGYKSGSTITTGNKNTCLGSNTCWTGSTAGVVHSTAIGYGTQIINDNTIILGNGDKVGIGTSTPAANALVESTGQTVLATTSGNVGIGITNPSSLLHVYSAGADVMTAATGGVNISGNLGVGTTSTEAKVAALNTVTQTAGTKSTYYSAIDHNAASDTTTENSIGMNFAATASGTHSHGTVLGVNGFVSHLGSGTLTQAQGGSFLVNNTSSGTISAAYGANYAFQISGSGNITNGIGVNVGAPVYTSTGKVSTVNFGVNVANQGNSGTANSAAIYIANQTGSSGLNASILTEGGLAWFNYPQNSSSNFQVSTANDAGAFFVKGSTDNIGIGTSTPSSKLHVASSGIDIMTAAVGGVKVTGTAVITNTVTGANAGSTICIDSNNRLCKCGSCS